MSALVAPDLSRMTLILFNKLLQADDPAGLIRRAHALQIDGYDLCVRPGYIVAPENAARRLPELAADFAAEGLAIPMITGRPDLLNPDDADVEPLLRAMDRSGIRVLKLGYFRFPRTERLDYAAAVAQSRAVLARWAALGKSYGVRVCCHVHASTGDFFLGSNAAALMDLIADCDPAAVGAYLDAGHLALEGEPFDLAAAVVRSHLAAVAVKDAQWVRSADGEPPAIRWDRAGEGAVDWGNVFATLGREAFAGPVSIHAEYHTASEMDFFAQLPREVAFFAERMRSAARLASAVPR